VTARFVSTAWVVSPLVEDGWPAREWFPGWFFFALVRGGAQRHSQNLRALQSSS
jgi:hypothetical protein